MFDAYLPEIAAAYAAAPELPTDADYPYVRALRNAWEELAQDSLERAAGIRLLLDVRETDDAEPYPDAGAMCADIVAGQFIVSRANSDHPLWTVEQNVAFRIVHDVLGHYAASVARNRPGLPFTAGWQCLRRPVGDDIASFDWAGENAACVAHARLLRSNPAARIALFTECIAQTGYAIRHGEFGPQKIADLSAWPLWVTEPMRRRGAWEAASAWARGDV